MRTSDWTSVFDENAQAPYAYSFMSDRQWVGYDDLRSITVKVIIDSLSTIMKEHLRLGSICKNIEFWWNYAVDSRSR